MSELHDLTALEQAAAIKAGETNTAELVEHYLARIERLNPTLGAFVTVTGDLARLAEVRADGPLAGVPTAIKDLSNTAGIKTTYGSAVYADWVPSFDDEVVRRIADAGLVSLGKTATPEFGSPCYTEPAGLPPAVTPWDTTRMAGGSSGGAAAAVGGGLVPLAHGSDGGGSIRIPASCCGLVGFKPSRGVISAAPAFGEPTGLATSGPIGRTVADVAAFLDVMAGRSVGDPFWAPTQPYLPAVRREPGRLRVGRFATPVIAEATVDPECLAAYERTSTLLAELGHEVEDIEVPIPADAVPVFETLWAVLTALSPVPDEARGQLRPLTRWLADRGRAVSGPEFGAALSGMRQIAARALIALAPYDVVLTPTLATPPLKVGALRDDANPERDFENQKRFTPFTSAWNITGMPAVSLPLHWTADGLPVGVMLAGRPAEDALLLSVAGQIEQAAPWRDRTAPCWT